MKKIPLLSILMMSSCYSMELPETNYSVESPKASPSSSFLANPAGQIDPVIEKKQFVSQIQDHVEKICSPLMSIVMNMKAAHFVPEVNPNKLGSYNVIEDFKKFYDLQENLVAFLNKEKNSSTEDIILKKLSEIFQELPTNGLKSRSDILEISKNLLRILTILKSTFVSEINDSSTVITELEIMKEKMLFLKTRTSMEAQESSFSDPLGYPEKGTIDIEEVRKTANRLEQQISHLPEFHDEFENTMLGLLKMSRNLNEMRSNLNFCNKAFTASEISTSNDTNSPLDEEFKKLLSLEVTVKETIKNIKSILKFSETTLENLEKTVDFFEKGFTDLKRQTATQDPRESLSRVAPRDQAKSDPFATEPEIIDFILQIRDHLKLMSSPLMSLLMHNSDSTILNSPASPQFINQFHELRKSAVAVLSEETNKLPEDTVLKYLNDILVEMDSIKLRSKREASEICKQIFGIIKTFDYLLDTEINIKENISLIAELQTRRQEIQDIKNSPNPGVFKSNSRSPMPQKSITHSRNSDGNQGQHREIPQSQRVQKITPTLKKREDIEVLRDRANSLEEQIDHLPEFYDSLEILKIYLQETQDDLETITSKFEFTKNEIVAKIYAIDDICPENDVKTTLLSMLCNLPNLKISVENKDKDISEILMDLKIITSNMENTYRLFDTKISSFKNEAVGHELLLSDSQKRNKPDAPQDQKKIAAQKLREAEIKMKESEIKALTVRTDKLEKQKTQLPLFYSDLEKLQSYLQETKHEAEEIMSEFDFHKNEISTRIYDIDDICPENDISSILLKELGILPDLKISDERKTGDINDVLLNIKRIIGNMETLFKSVDDTIGSLKRRATAAETILNDSQKGSKPSIPQNDIDPLRIREEKLEEPLEPSPGFDHKLEKILMEKNPE